jgi:nicotinate-nucleotide adenylyltransferase
MRQELSMEPQRIGILGGKFDPIHGSHLMCAEMTREAFRLDLVLFVTSANPPHKATGVLDASIRHEMVSAAVAPNCFFKASDIELKRKGLSYTLDTVREVRRLYPGAELFLLMSSEYLDPSHPWYLSKWHDVQELFGLCTILIFCGRGQTIEQAQEWGKLLPQARFEYLTFCPAAPISSTMIRERIAKGLSVWYMVLPEVWQIIRDRKLYGFKGMQCPIPTPTGRRRLWRCIRAAWRSIKRRLS